MQLFWLSWHIKSGLSWRKSPFSYIDKITLTWSESSFKRDKGDNKLYMDSGLWCANRCQWVWLLQRVLCSWVFIKEGGTVSWIRSDWVLDSPDHTDGKSTKAEQGNTNTETARQVGNRAPLIFIHPSFQTRYHIINTMTTALILRPLTGHWGRCIYFPLPQKKTSSVLYTQGRWTYNDSSAITGLTVTSWVCEVVKLGLVITGRCQNADSLHQSTW